MGEFDIFSRPGANRSGTVIGNSAWMDGCVVVTGSSSAHRQVGHAIFGNLLGMLVEMMHVKFGLVWFEKKEDDLPTNSTLT